MAFKHLAEPRGILDAAQLRVKDTSRKIAGDLYTQMEKRGFGDLVTNDRRGAKAGCLTADLGTYGSSGAGDQYSLALQLFGNAIMFKINRGPAQQLLDRNVGDLTEVPGSPPDPEPVRNRWRNQGHWGMVEPLRE